VSRRLPLLTLFFAALLGAAGCGHYRLGTGVAPQFATLHVAVVKSEALLPQATVLFTTELREAFIKDGRVRLVDSPDEAEAVLTVRLDDYSRGVAVTRADDTGLARRFDLTLAARATLTDHRAGKDYFSERPLVVKRGSFTDGGQVQSEYQTLPLLAGQLAEQVRKAVLEVW
jgi:outer membrane lipopolysaccharide assembly protein LptE/RlpB